MRVVRLAQILGLKYGLRAEAASLSQDRILAEVKRDILDIYRNYFSRTARDSMFQFAADTGNAAAIKLTYDMDRLVKGLEKPSPEKLMHGLNSLLSTLLAMKEDPQKSVRQSIADAIPARTEPQRNTRERALVKYERSLSYSFSALQKAATKLHPLVPDVSVLAGNISRERGELTKQQLIDFVLSSSPFKNYNLTSLDVIEEFLSDPELKGKLTTVINAVKRGHYPLDGLEVYTLAKEIKERLENRAQTNIPSLENEELPPVIQKDEE